MKRYFLSLIILLFAFTSVKANHITGGEMYYTLVSQSGTSYTYQVTVKLFKDVISGTVLDNPINIAIYNKASNVLVWDSAVGQSSLSTITATPGPCIVNPPLVSYQVGLYVFQVTLPSSTFGYVITWARCCRVVNITNLLAPSSSSGATYTAEIPGNAVVPDAARNNSARFLGIDTVIICAGYPFTYNFGATDADRDQLTYEFCAGYTNTGGTVPNPPAPPPYVPLTYANPYSDMTPMGSTVTIDPATGKITGTAPPAGVYVVTVCVKEWRNGVVIATQRKDLQIKVADCDVATVTLEPNGYTNCNDYTVAFNNLSPSSLISSYFWDFGDVTTLGDTSRIANPSYMYPDTGVYTVKVVANRNQPCSDSTTAKVRVFPGFNPDFSVVASCLNVPAQFTDLTTATYGTINFWRYDFGVTSVTSDTSRLQNPQFTYTAVGNYSAQFIVGSSKGCRDTIYKMINVFDKPPISVGFKDTLICNIDTLRLSVSGSGVFQWTPNYNIINSNSANPLVYPKITTWYKVELNDNGCRNEDSVRVRVVDHVNLTVSSDTTICANDPVLLNANTDGLHYAWTPTASLSNPTILNPIALPSASTTYQIISSIGNCTTTEDIVVTVAQRPIVNAGPDVQICYNESTQLNAQTTGTSFSWSPTTFLSDPNILNPVVTPASTTLYILSAIDNLSGCPKPTSDTVVVTVLPEVHAFAGNDTVIIAGLPLQLKATGGDNYLWSPATGLNDPTLQGPIALLDGNPEYVTYVVNVTDQAGCSDTASITIRVYKTGPDIFVPTGFTPNNDGRNDVFRPIYVGIKEIDYFRVYNRWGNLIYSNNKNDGTGWDGTINGIKQNTGTFIWVVKAIDILGNTHLKKGTITLIR